MHLGQSGLIEKIGVNYVNQALAVIVQAITYVLRNLLNQNIYLYP